jgi:anthranilate phosphoribosyltransferase
MNNLPQENSVIDERLTAFLRDHCRQEAIFAQWEMLQQAVDRGNHKSRMREYDWLKKHAPQDATYQRGSLYDKRLAIFVKALLPDAPRDAQTIRGISALIRKHAVLETFCHTRSSDEEIVYKSLKSLTPARISDDERMMLSDFIRAEAQQWKDKNRDHPVHHPHVASFGTGGDSSHTINISTIAAAIASHFLAQQEHTHTAVVKPGTVAVTGKFGSAQVASELRSYYKKESAYISLGEMGFPYSSALIKARQRLHQEAQEQDGDTHTYLDPYKHLFPGSNLTNARYVVTGYAHTGHLDYLKALATYHGSRSCFVHNKDTGSDEFLAGENTILLPTKTGWREYVTRIGNPKEKRYRQFIQERETKDKQIQAAKDVLAANCPDSVLEVMAYNVALMVMAEFPQSTLDEVARDVYHFLLKQRDEPVIVRGATR